MLRAEDQMELAVLKRHGESIRELARLTGWSRNTVRRYLREGEAACRRKSGPVRVEKLDPYKDYIIGRLRAAAPDRIPAVVLFREVRSRGYGGGETRLKEFVRGLAPVAVEAPVVRFETEPGRQMQADWASVGRGDEKLSVFIGTMGWSRAAYVEFCDDERVETLISCHDNAFRALGGVPVEALLDNMKTVVIGRNVYGQGLHRFHPAFLDYARHAGFVPRLCAPYRPQTKGKVERFIGYLKRSFWIPFVASMRQAGLRPDKQAANAAAARWLREVANARVHGTTGEVPAVRLALERTLLQGLPAPYAGRSARSVVPSPMRKPVIGYQHPLALYEELAAAGGLA